MQRARRHGGLGDTAVEMYSSGQNKVNVRLACNDRATVIPFSFRTRFVFVL